MKNYAIVDTETTGLDSRYHEIIDIWISVIDPNTLKIIKEDGGRIKPLRIWRMSDAAAVCNGYTDEKWINAEPRKDVLDRVYPLIEGNIWIGHNPIFDISFVQQAFLEFDRHKAINIFNVNCIDTKDLCRGVINVPDHRLDTICKHLDIDTKRDYGLDPHTARADVYRCIELMKHLFVLNE